MKKLKRKGINQSDFERRKKIIFASYIKMYDSTWDIANELIDNAFYDTDIFGDARIVEEISVADVEAYLKEVCRENNMTYSIIKQH